MTMAVSAQQVIDCQSGAWPCCRVNDFLLLFCRCELPGRQAGWNRFLWTQKRTACLYLVGAACELSQS